MNHEGCLNAPSPYKSSNFHSKFKTFGSLATVQVDFLMYVRVIFGALVAGEELVVRYDAFLKEVADLRH